MAAYYKPIASIVASILFRTLCDKFKMASEESAKPVTNERCDVNSENDYIVKPIIVDKLIPNESKITWKLTDKKSCESNKNSVNNHLIKTPSGTPTNSTSASLKIRGFNEHNSRSCERKDLIKSHGAAENNTGLNPVTVTKKLVNLFSESGKMSGHCRVEDANVSTSLVRNTDGKFCNVHTLHTYHITYNILFVIK